MDNELKILITAILDKAKSKSNINAQLKQLKIDTLKLNVNIGNNQANIKTEIQKITKQANNITSSGIEKVNIPLSFDKENMQNLKRELEQFANEIAKLEGYKEARVTANYKTSYDEFGVTNVMELDKALVDLQMATGGTKPQIQQLLNTYTDLGKEIGATTTEVAALSFQNKGISNVKYAPSYLMGRAA